MEESALYFTGSVQSIASLNKGTSKKYIREQKKHDVVLGKLDI